MSPRCQARTSPSCSTLAAGSRAQRCVLTTANVRPVAVSATRLVTRIGARQPEVKLSTACSRTVKASLASKVTSALAASPPS